MRNKVRKRKRKNPRVGKVCAVWVPPYFPLVQFLKNSSSRNSSFILSHFLEFDFLKLEFY